MEEKLVFLVHRVNLKIMDSDSHLKLSSFLFVSFQLNLIQESIKFE